MTSNTHFRRWLPVALASTWFASAPLMAQVPAQSEGPLPPASQLPPAPPAASQVEEQKLDQFADAFVVVESIQRQALQRIEQETDQSKVAAVKAEAESDALKAVEKSGLPVDEFNQIVQQMMVDVSLRERVAARVAQRRPAAEPVSEPTS